MSLVLNMVGGGGGGSLKGTDAILTVTVPTGSTVTAAKGGTTLTPTMWVQAADPTLDCALFVIAPSLFDATTPWLVTATKDIGVDSETVIIDDNLEYSVSLNPVLPAEYQLVEYLQSSGTQYINTGLSILSESASIEISGKYSYTESQSSTAIFGCQSGSRISPFFWMTASRQLLAMGGGNTNTLATLSYSFGADNTFDFEFTGGTFNLNWNGSAYSGAYNQNFPTGLEMYLFASHYNGVSQFSHAKVYSWEIFTNGTKQRELYPCYRKSDSVAGLFDKASQAFFTNAGTGSFVVGGDI